jgi:hypothetical protein
MRAELLLCCLLAALAAAGDSSLQVETLIDMGHSASYYAFFYQVAAAPGGQLFFSDTRGHCIRKWTQEGGLQDFAGRCGQSGSRDGAGLAALLSHPKGLCVSPQGYLAVVDAGNACLRSVSMTGLL